MERNHKQFLEQLLAACGIAYSSVDEQYDDRFSCRIFSIAGSDAALSGNREAVQSLQQLLREHIDDESLHVAVDIGGDFVKKLNMLQTDADILIERALLLRRPFELPPMSSYDRRLVHAYVSSIPHVITRSVGEGEQRRIMIEPEPGE